MRLGYRAVFGIGIALGALAACSSDDDGKTSGGSGGAGNGDCFPTAPSCYGPGGPSGPGHECLAKTDNSGQKIWKGRLSQIQVTKPDALAKPFIQSTILDKGVNFNQPECNSNGKGTFNWLFEFDSESNKLKMGGGLPIENPGDPGCFAVLPDAQIPVAPVTIDVTMNGNTFSADGIDLTVPIFVTPGDTTNVVLLPIHGGKFQGTFSADHNCIGAYNGDKLDPAIDCLADMSVDPPIYPWENGGTIEGYIGVEESDTVFIPDLKNSLCVLLAGAADWKGTDGYCKTSTKWVGGERPQGDWCIATNQPATADCADAYRLTSGFAANAYPISGDCE
ncbi:MAG: hypothetical protein OZ921_14735 [Sorangiineae bacterium]|nr:hypothetical protein [Polyangiaceae bacterium]MEB2323765.1 hypothetical protein [Sorangiineae bacterium]